MWSGEGEVAASLADVALGTFTTQHSNTARKKAVLRHHSMHEIRRHLRVAVYLMDVLLEVALIMVKTGLNYDISD